MLAAIVLCHPQSSDLLSSSVFKSKFVNEIRIACGTTKIPNILSEANDFYPTYASWNTALFETSVILTVWEHADELVGDSNVAILHSDIKPHFRPSTIWKNVEKAISDGKTVGLVSPVDYIGEWPDWEIPEEHRHTPRNDPMLLHIFDSGVYVWDYIKKYDPDMFQWAMDVDPVMLWSHQFACSRKIFDSLGFYLYDIAKRLCLVDVGLWTPHMFERLIALFFARYSSPILTTAFWHYSSSGVFGPGSHNLYGPRPRKYYHTSHRIKIDS